MKLRTVATVLSIMVLSLGALLLGGRGAADDSCATANEKVKQALLPTVTKESAISLYREAIGQCPKMVEALHNLGVLLSERAETREEAVTQLKKAIEIRDEPSFRASLGALFLQLERTEEAKAQYEAALIKDPSFVPALLGLSVSYDRLGNLDKALTIALDAARAATEDPLTQYNAGVFLYRKKQFDEAAEAFRKVLSQESKNPAAQLYLGLALDRLGNSEEAEQALLRAAEIDPTNPNVYRALGMLYERSEDYEKAELNLRKALAREPEEGETLTNLAVVLIKKQQPGLAESETHKALARQPNESRIHAVHGWALLELGKYKEAETSLTRALELDPKNGDALNNLGVLYQRLGRTEEAAAAYERSLALNPHSEIAADNLRELQ